jgi:hypothetical protein
MSTDDIYARKKAFLEGQVRRLTTTLGPSREFKAAAAAASLDDHAKLSETMVDNAIYKRILHCEDLSGLILSEFGITETVQTSI